MDKVQTDSASSVTFHVLWILCVCVCVNEVLSLKLATIIKNIDTFLSLFFIF